jgi:hypothetical protein
MIAVTVEVHECRRLFRGGCSISLIAMSLPPRPKNESHELLDEILRPCHPAAMQDIELLQGADAHIVPGVVEKAAAINRRCRYPKSL